MTEHIKLVQCLYCRHLSENYGLDFGKCKVKKRIFDVHKKQNCDDYEDGKGGC
jgi:hypothetical protein